MSLLNQIERIAKLGSLKLVYHNIEHFISLNGRPFRPAPYPEGMRRGQIMVCFGNSHRLAKRKRLIYVEGFAMRQPNGFGVLHAWCSDETGSVIDPTWGEGAEYFGVPLDFKYVRQNTSDDNMSVLDQWQRGYPIFSDPPELWRYKGTIKDADLRRRNR